MKRFGGDFTGKLTKKISILCLINQKRVKNGKIRRKKGINEIISQ
jgi:hypothetical protein